MDKIRILLVDDKPTFASPSAAGVPTLRRKWAKHFELFWLQNAQEARFLLDTFSTLSSRRPDAAFRASLPPEILVFDYALTQKPEQDRAAHDPTDIVERLREVMAQCNLYVRRTMPPPPSTGADIGQDRTGCYVGGELARVFGAHPCGAVPTTARVDTSDSDAAFYEWLNQEYFMDLFKAKHRGEVTWDVLIPIGVQSLRERMIQLALSGLLRMSPSALQSLLDAPQQMRNGSLTMHSRYGRRVLPIAGLFVDVLPPVKPNDAEFAEEAETWAGQMLNALFGGCGRNEFAEARALAARYYAAYVNEASKARYKLSELAALMERDAEEEATLETLCTAFGLDLAKVRSSPDTVKDMPPPTLPSLHTEASSPEVARWAVLMLAVRAEQHGRQAEGGQLEEEDLPVRCYATLDDIWQMLEPLPESLLTFMQQKKGQQKKGSSSPPRRGKETSIVTNQLKRLGSHGDHSRWGPLGLNLRDVLENRPFDCALCRAAIEAGQESPAGEHVDSRGQRYSHGLRTGEGALLRAYADEIGYPDSEWPTWLTDAP